MKTDSRYIKHQAFNVAHNEVIKEDKKSDDGFVRPQRYHHAPEKLKVFTSYVGYFHWSNELYSASSELIVLLRKIYDRAVTGTP